MIKKLFFCESCRQKVADVSQIHFVEDHSDRGFCSEKCILDFYRPYMQTLEDEEDHLRRGLSIAVEDDLNGILASEHYLQLTLNSPSEIWQVENDLNQKFHTHINEISLDDRTYYMILICSYIDGAPSFVFYRTLTESIELLNKYRRDYQVEVSEEPEEYIDDKNQQIEIAQDIIKQVEFKKSFLLATMLEKRSPKDIELEKFALYDDYLELTLMDPDEVYEFEDDEGDKLHTCIKSYQKDNDSFFYVILAMPYVDPNNKDTTVMIPILGFPSTDKNLYPQYAVGNRIGETLKN